jgi:hypothetical protein
LRLMTSSTLVESWTGGSPAFSPLTGVIKLSCASTKQQRIIVVGQNEPKCPLSIQ